jgi:hypothetical protein
MSHHSRFESSTLGVKRAYVEFTVGTSGAMPALTACTRARDLASGPVASGTSTITLPLAVGWTALVGHDVKVQQATYNKAHGGCGYALTTDNVAGSSPSVAFTILDAAGDAVALLAGDIVKITLDLKKSAGLA